MILIIGPAIRQIHALAYQFINIFGKRAKYPLRSCLDVTLTHLIGSVTEERSHVFALLDAFPKQMKIQIDVSNQQFTFSSP